MSKKETKLKPQPWQELLTKLKTYQEQHGHFNVAAHEPDTQLAQWVENLNTSFPKLPTALQESLKEIGFQANPLPHWEKMYKKLQAYVQTYHHSYVPKEGADYNDLYNWCRLQRQAKDQLTSAQIQALDLLGFDWELLTDDALRWERRYQELVGFFQQHGHTLVPQLYKPNPPLAGWVSKQRKSQKQDKLKAAQVEKLQALGFLWQEDIEQRREENWQTRYEQLRTYLQDKESLNRFQLRKEHYQLCLWVITQLTCYHKNILKPDRKAKLDELGFRWEKDDYRQERWEEMYDQLVHFREQYGHCRVTKKRYQLRNWVARQKQRPDLLSAEQRKKLQTLGFLWANELFPQKWQARYQELVAFSEQHGHCRVPKSNKGLWEWVSDQRKQEESLSEERRKKLEKIGFIWANQIWEQQLREWDEHYERFKAFKDQYGEQYLLHLKQEPDLNRWVNLQLHSKDKLAPYKKEKLNQISFPWNRKQPQKDQLWERYYAELIDFQHQYGHCLVNKHFPAHTSLAHWVAAQRLKPLTEEKKAKLDAIGFTWKNQIKEERWYQRLTEARQVIQQHGYLKAHSQSQLGAWLYQQRKNLTKLPPEKQQLLKELRIG